MEAEQWFPGKRIDGLEEMEGGIGQGLTFPTYGVLDAAHVVHPGDWIVTDSHGKRHLVSADDFAALFETME